jgi:hypothetical protein
MGQRVCRYALVLVEMDDDQIKIPRNSLVGL